MSTVQSRRRRPTPLVPEIDPRLRSRIEVAIEALLAVLDAADGDIDLEDSHDVESIDECEPDDEGDELDAGETGWEGDIRDRLMRIGVG